MIVKRVILMLHITVMLVCCAGAFGRDVPIVRVPFVKKAPVIDGNPKRDEWQEAAVLKSFERPNEGAWTQVFIQYDDKALYIAGIMGERESGYPFALPRKPNEANADDALLVGIGLDGKNKTKKLSMGGYENATAELGKMKQLYQFIVNAAGSKVQILDECPVQNPGCEAKIMRGKFAWKVEMRIPFSAIGLDKIPTTDTFLHFNVVRIRPPMNIGWHGMSSWVGFTRFPTGRMELLPEQQNDKKTIERFSKKADIKLQNFKKQEIVYYPLADKIVATFKINNMSDALIMLDGQTVDNQKNLPAGLHRLSVNAKTLNLHSGQKITLTLLDLVTHNKQQIEHTVPKIPQKPAWLFTNAGIQYTDQKTPKPWISPRIDGTTIKLAHGKIKIAANALPESIQMSVGELLKTPMKFVICRNNQPVSITFKNPISLRQDGHSILAYAKGTVSGGGFLNVLTRIDFDGFMALQFQLADCLADKVQLKMDLVADAGKFISQGHADNISSELGAYAYQSPASALFWVGGWDRGIAISDDLNAFRSNNIREEIVIKPQSDGGRLVTLTFVDSPKQLEMTNGVLQFYLQPTPVRPASRVVENDYKMIFENWSDYQGYPDLSKLGKVKEFIGQTRAENKIPLVYFNQMLASNSPGFGEFRDELVALPERMWYKRAYNPGKGVPCYVCCVRGPYGQLLLSGIEKLCDAGLCGLYMDGTTIAWDCDNPAHDMCASPPPSKFGEIQSGRIIGTRRFLMRLRGIFDKSKKPIVFIAHTGGALDPNTLGFVDYVWEGEWLAAKLPGKQIPLSNFAIGFTGTPWGWRTMLYDRHWIKGLEGNTALLYSLLHGTDLRHGKTSSWYEQFGKPWSINQYWRADSPVMIHSKKGNSVASVYRSSDKPLVVVGNMGVDTDDLTINLGKVFGYEDVQLIDLFTDKKFVLHNGLLKVSLKGYNGLALTSNAKMPDKSN